MSRHTVRSEVGTREDPRWAAIVARDPKADGRFFYSVRSTGVYCRPSCGARIPKPENICLYPTAMEAEAAGFRPCKRCRPTQPTLPERNATLVTELCRLIEQSGHMPSLAELAAHAKMSVFHLHRLFKAATGLTPRAYALARRAGKLRESLIRCQSVTSAIYDAGYTSSGRFYEDSNRVLGLTPVQFRHGGNGETIHFATGKCSLGTVLAASSSRGVCAILIGNSPNTLRSDLQRRFRNAKLIESDRNFRQKLAKVIEFIERPKIGLDLPLDIRGTIFQQRVWQALREIPPGSTASYSEIARRIGMPKGTRAVAKACAANSIAVAIPCHRVLRNDGSLSGYRWGIERKRKLLETESRSKSQTNK